MSQYFQILDKLDRLIYLNQFDQLVNVLKTLGEIQQILRVYLNSPCAGHYAADMTYQRLVHKFYWPTMYSDTYSYVRSCHKCQMAQALNEFKVAPLHPIVSLEPFELVTVDYTGPFPTAAGGIKYLFFVVEHLTCWLRAIATRKSTGTATIPALENKYVPRYGYLVL